MLRQHMPVELAPQCKRSRASRARSTPPVDVIMQLSSLLHKPLCRSQSEAFFIHDCSGHLKQMAGLLLQGLCVMTRFDRLGRLRTTVRTDGFFR